VFDAAGLTARESYVVAEGWERTLEEIASDAPMLKADGTPCTRQRIHQLEAAARGKLGMPSRSALQEADRMDRGLDLAARGRGVVPAELHNLERRRIGQRERVERRRDRHLSGLTIRFIREAEAAGGGLSDDRRAYYAACFAG
jgi:hypothetical protein